MINYATMNAADKTGSTTAVSPLPGNITRHPAVTASTVDGQHLLHQPLTQRYLLLTPTEYALWWQLDGRTSPLDLLRYANKRYANRRYANGRFATFPPDQLQTLLRNLRDGQFVVEAGKTAVFHPPSPPPNSIIGFHDLLRPLARRLAPFFSRWGQLTLLFIIYLGSGLLLNLLRLRQLPLFLPGVWSLLTLPLAAFLIHLLRQLGRGTWLAHHGATVATATWGWTTGLQLDTSDSQRLPQSLRRQLPLVGPLTTLLAGSVGGLLLTAVSRYAPQFLTTPNLFSHLTFGALPQLTLLAYLYTLASLNPLTASDGYTWLAQRWQLPPNPRAFWYAPRQLWRNKRPFYLLLSGLYLLLWLFLIGYAWNSQLLSRPPAHPLLRPFLAAASLLLLPPLRWLAYATQPWRQQIVAWVRTKPLLARPATLFIVLAPPLLILPLLLVTLAISQPILPLLLTWLLHLAAIATWWRLTRGHPASLRLTHWLWLVTLIMGCLALAWLVEPMPVGREGVLLLAGLLLLAMGMQTAVSQRLQRGDWLLLGLGIVLGIGSGWYLGITAEGTLTAVARLLVIATTLGTAGLLPLLLRLHGTRFVGGWYTLLPPLFALPWLLVYPQLHLFILILFLFAGLFYLVSHTVIPKNRPQSTVFAQLSTVFQHFLQQLLNRAELLLGKRPLHPLYSQLAALNVSTTAQTAVYQQAFLLAADRLMRLSNADFVAQLVQQVAQSLPWQPRYLVSQRLLAPAGWDAPFVAWERETYWQREQLLRQTAVFPTHRLPDLLRLGQERRVAAGDVVAYAGAPCAAWSLLLVGQVQEEERPFAPGCWFGGEGLLGMEGYEKTVTAVSDVILLDLPYADLLPLLAAHRQTRQQLAQIRQLHPWLQPHFTQREQILLAARMQPQFLPATTPLPPAGLYLLQSGALTTPTDTQLEPGAIVGIEWLWGESAAQACITVTPSHLWLLPRAKFTEMISVAEDSNPRSFV